MIRPKDSGGARGPNHRTSMRGCSAIVTLGSVITKFSGSAPPVRSSSVPKKSSSVRAARPFHSSPSDLMRIPMNGGRMPSAIARAASPAARTATVSSSASGRAPNPSSKSIRKSSTASASSFCFTRSYTVSTSQSRVGPGVGPSGFTRPTARAKSPASAAYVSRARRAASPRRRVVSAR